MNEVDSSFDDPPQRRIFDGLTNQGGTVLSESFKALVLKSPIYGGF